MTLPLARRIIHNPAILANRWHIADTSIAVGEVRLDHAAHGKRRSYRYPGLSAEELAACLAFAFPPSRESTVSMLAGVVVISCACGEDTSATGVLSDPVHCVCGRVWRLRLLLEPMREDGMPVGNDPVAVVMFAAP